MTTMPIELDRDGYPDAAGLMRLQRWEPLDCDGALEFATPAFRGHGVVTRRPSGLWTVATGGWSGCEDVIGALRLNWLWWMHNWHASKSGGAHVFGGRLVSEFVELAFEAGSDDP